MNRLPATGLESDDSDSDWDSTVAEKLQRGDGPGTSAASRVKVSIEGEGDYATVTPKPRTSLKDQTEEQVNKVATPQEDSSQDTTPPPPHLTSFQKALSDFPRPAESIPELPARQYDEREKHYILSEAQQGSPVRWDDSDAEERVLKELQENREKEKHRQKMIKERKVALAVTDTEKSSAQPSPMLSRGHDKRVLGSESKRPQSQPKDVMASVSQISLVSPRSNELSHVKSQDTVSLPRPDPLLVKDALGKKAVVYFEEGTPHYLELVQDDLETFLPEKVHELERLFQRMWREVFSLLRIVTSFAVLMVVELLLYLFGYVVKPLVLGVLFAIGDHFLKPSLTMLFNHVLQPLMAFLWNLLNASHHTLSPVVTLLGELCSQVAIVLRAFRLFVLNWNSPGARTQYRNEVEFA